MNNIKLENKYFFQVNELEKNFKKSIKELRIEQEEKDNKILNYNYNDPYIFEKKNIIDNKTCKEIIDLFECDNNKRRGEYGLQQINVNVKNTTDLLISVFHNWIEYDKIIFNNLSILLSEYIYKLNNINCYAYNFLNSSIFFDNGFQIQKYIKNNGKYIWHNDSKEKLQNRMIAFIIYLNDVEEGGETMFHNFKIKPETGKVIFFPSSWTYIHKGCVPISNDKYIITGWFSIPNEIN